EPPRHPRLPGVRRPGGGPVGLRALRPGARRSRRSAHARRMGARAPSRPAGARVVAVRAVQPGGEADLPVDAISGVRRPPARERGPSPRRGHHRRRLHARRRSTRRAYRRACRRRCRHQLPPARRLARPLLAAQHGRPRRRHRREVAREARRGHADRARRRAARDRVAGLPARHHRALHVRLSAHVPHRQPLDRRDQAADAPRRDRGHARRAGPELRAAHLGGRRRCGRGAGARVPPGQRPLPGV
ncbi:MAG: hypothetical protein AVDCRST_MAG30-791, partial [uncultured Solirubrobacteraceae bacterium]